MVKLISVFVLATLLSGCGWFNRATSVFTEYTRVCVSNVSYLQFPTGVTVEYNVDGSVKTCGIVEPKPSKMSYKF